MKLPTENVNGGGEQGAGTPAENGSGAGGVEGPSGEGPSSSPSAAAGASENSGPQPGPGQPGGPENVDFSEYLWMENEEEFDSQVLQELEDEEMINYYYELYEASLNENGTWGPNTANIRVSGPPPPFSSSNPPAAPPGDDDPVESLTQGINTRLTFSSRLNPEAAEFVPRTSN